ncbi:VWA domain-containing protein [Stieleria sp. TO1_6]|nr:VWA domain-containing protein [Stieleria tagensis]
MDIQIGDLIQLNWLWLVPLCIATGVYAVVATRRARQRFATADLIGRVLPPTSSRRLFLRTLLVAGSLVLLVLALIDVRWGKVWRDVPQKGIEVMFVLDVSRSMLAEDTTPNRLSRAKQQISDTIDEMAGDRVGLVVFAGTARQQVPLTSHYEDFKQTLDSVGPHSVRMGGSRLGDAIATAADGFLSKTNDHKAIVILTDGEDQESEPLRAAKLAASEHGIRIFTIGLGDMDQGARIPVQSDNQRQYVQHDGQQVWSKLNGKVLQQIATETNGAYIPAGTKRVNMADVYHGYIAKVEQQEFEMARINSYEARFQWFLAPALLMLLAEIVVSTWPRRRSATQQGFGGNEGLGDGQQVNETTRVAA